MSSFMFNVLIFSLGKRIKREEQKLSIGLTLFRLKAAVACTQFCTLTLNLYTAGKRQEKEK